MLLPGVLFALFGVVDTSPSPILTDVRIGNHGPYRFLVDTGAQTSLIAPDLAAELRLEPRFRVELVTQHGARLAPATRVSGMTLGQRALPEIEVLFHDVAELRRVDSSIKGIIGLNALTGFDYTLSPSTRRLDDAAERPAGEVVPFQRIEGRMAVKARMGRESLTLIVDSGASHVVLFRVPAAMAKTPPVSAMFTTLDGARSVAPTCWTAEMAFTDRLRVGSLPAAIVQRQGAQVDGLLPASVFKKIYVDQARGELVMVR
jgi:predicted aspartyl protease